MGDGGGCPEIDSRGRPRFRCVECDVLMAANVSSAICGACHVKRANMDPDEREYDDLIREYARESGNR